MRLGSIAIAALLAACATVGVAAFAAETPREGAKDSRVRIGISQDHSPLSISEIISVSWPLPSPVWRGVSMH